ncbi:MAG: reverse transcriptase-like protein [Pseudomonadota bacterium]|nr:reverse transcriptase-like protein [Pseudomonadota bacterium]
MHSADPRTGIRRAQTQRINRAVDEALQSSDAEALLALLTLAADEATIPLCDRVFRRATRLARRDRTETAAVIAARNRRVLEIYAHRAPKGWFSAWCDGSSTTDAGGRCAGIGLVLMDAQHEVIAALGEPAGALSPLDAELAALAATVKMAVARGAGYLRVHTDCLALVHLWQGRHDDDSLAGLRETARPLRRLQLRLVPRRFNQVANALARNGVRAPQTGTGYAGHPSEIPPEVGNDRS